MIVVPDAFALEGGEFVARVESQPGWGVMLVFRIGNPNSHEPNRRAHVKAIDPELGEILTRPALPGVRVRHGVDDLGRSDANGTVLVTSEGPLDHVSLEADGWRLCGLERMPGSGSRWIAWMEREP